MSTAVVLRSELDDDVARAIASGDHHRALTLLMDRYGGDVYRFAFDLGRDDAVAEEVRQQTYIEAFRDLERFEGRSAWKTWLFGIARHRYLDLTKAGGRWARRFKNEAPEDDAPLAEVDVERDLDRERIARLLADCLGRLAPAAREAVALRYQQDLSYDEAAEVTGERAGTLQQRVARAMPVLRRCVEGKLDRG